MASVWVGKKESEGQNSWKNTKHMLTYTLNCVRNKAWGSLEIQTKGIAT